MSAKSTVERSRQGDVPAETPPAHASIGWRIAGFLLRTLFIGVLLAVTVRVSAPQSESIWSAYETPGDLIRLALGVAVGLWILFHLFTLPKDPETYKTWVYLGLVVAPFALAVAIAVW
jgi:hypothetical protein